MISGWEALAVLLSILYLILALRENRLCFVAGFFSSCIFVGIFLNTRLYMESGLQLFYAAMSIYGWWQWQPNGGKKEALVISRWTLKQHLLSFSAIIFLSALTCMYLNSKTQAVYPFLDSFVTWGSLVTTFMVTQKILENWLYWVVLDFIALCLYFKQGLYLSSGLFVIFVIIALLGQIRWFKKFCAEVSAQAQTILPA